ncbi:hypothetical protein, partial [Mangrovimonas futianensis]|uniref:hypothetical protein n=1 Tax=Mangrovimonas futianensis TaxID=2895523 RepID=UPI001E515A73
LKLGFLVSTQDHNIFNSNLHRSREGFELWERGSQGRSPHLRSGWTSSTLSSVAPFATMALVLSAELI